MSHRLAALAAALIAAATLWGCAKNGNNGAGTTAQASPEAATDTSTAASPSSSSDVATSSNGAGNAKVYLVNCSSCHQTNGKGMPGAFPPLAGNPVVTGDPKTVIHIVKYGLTGKIEAEGNSYNGIMPPWGSQLSPGDIAQAITYIRSSWGNNASAVTAAQVSAVSK
jgi:mono/diheme cytochrome c family protein